MSMSEAASGSLFEYDVVVIGGGGHVGVPLAIALADCGAPLAVYDANEATVGLVNGSVMPFAEPGAQPKLEAARAAGKLVATTEPAIVGRAENVIVVIGTPVDEHLNPDPRAIPD